MLFHDDALNHVWMNGYNLLSIFAIDGKTDASARPMADTVIVPIQTDAAELCRRVGR